MHSIRWREQTGSSIHSHSAYFTSISGTIHFALCLWCDRCVTYAAQNNHFELSDIEIVCLAVAIGKERCYWYAKSWRKQDKMQSTWTDQGDGRASQMRTHGRIRQLNFQLQCFETPASSMVCSFGNGCNPFHSFCHFILRWIFEISISFPHRLWASANNCSAAIGEQCNGTFGKQRNAQHGNSW